MDNGYYLHIVKSIVILLTIFLSSPVKLCSQNIFITKHESTADIKVYVVEHKSQADLLVYINKYPVTAGKNDGKWYFVKYESQSNLTICYVPYENQCDLKIYYVKYKTQSKWITLKKKRLLESMNY